MATGQVHAGAAPLRSITWGEYLTGAHMHRATSLPCAVSSQPAAHASIAPAMAAALDTHADAGQSLGGMKRGRLAQGPVSPAKMQRQ